MDAIAIAVALRGLAARGSLLHAKLLHHHRLASAAELPLLPHALVHLYGACGSLPDARSILSRLPRRDPASWNALISSYNLHRRPQEALDCFHQMRADGVPPDAVSCIAAFLCCGMQERVRAGMEVHQIAVKCGYDADDAAVHNSALSMYGRCGFVEDARAVFDRRTSQDDAISWNAVIAMYSCNGCEVQALECFHQMSQNGVIPNRITYVSILSLCSNTSSKRNSSRCAVFASKLNNFRFFHVLVLNNDLHHDVVASTAMINMYGKMGDVRYARRIFDDMPDRNVISWNSMISTYAQHSQRMRASQLFYTMHQENVLASGLTFISILEACSDCRDFNEGKRLHVFLRSNGFESDIVITNALLNMYGKCHRLDKVKELFDAAAGRNDITWNVVITCCSQNQQAGVALLLFNQMLQEGTMLNKVTYIAALDACTSQEDLTKGSQIHAQIVASHLKLDNMVGNCLLSLYNSCDCASIARELFDEELEHDVFSWSTMIGGFSQKGKFKEARFLFGQMAQDGVIPNKITYVNILAVCSSEAAQIEGKRIHALLMSQGLELDLVIANSLITLHGKCGSSTDAQTIFDLMPERDIISWTAMIAAYAQHGESERTRQLFYQMKNQGIFPNKITFLSIISACGHAGEIEEGYYWFVSIDRRYGLTPTMDHYNCMIDLLGRAGRLDEAENVMMSMSPSDITIVSLMALLSSCKYQTDVDRGERLSKQAFTLFPECPEPYIMLANIYSSAGSVRDAEILMALMRSKGLEEQIEL